MVGFVLFLLVAGGSLVLLLAALMAWELTHPPRRTAAFAIARSLPVDPGDLQLPFQECALQRPDGARLPWWLISTRESEFPDVAVVLLHGWGRSRIDSLGRVRPWQSLVGSIAIPELRGHGDSTGGISRCGDLEVRDILALIDQIPASRIVLVGHSLGACTALWAATISDRVAAVVAYGPYSHVQVPMNNRLAAKSMPGPPVSSLALLMVRLLGGIRFRENLDCRPAVPMLVLQGRDDRITPGPDVEAVARSLGARLEWLEGGHEDTHLVNPSHHDDIVRAFARDALASRSQAPSQAPITPGRR